MSAGTRGRVKVGDDYVSVQGRIVKGTLAFDPADTEEYRKQIRLKGWVDGTPMTNRTEPSSGDWRHADVKYLFGYRYKPFVECYEGWTTAEAHLHFKSLFMPEGKTSLTQLERDEMRAFTDDVTRNILEEHPKVVLREPAARDIEQPRSQRQRAHGALDLDARGEGRF